MALPIVEARAAVIYDLIEAASDVRVRPRPPRDSKPVTRLQHYTRQHELVLTEEPAQVIPFGNTREALALSPLSRGSQIVTGNFLHEGDVAYFGEGGLGINIEFLKDGVRPDIFGEHAKEIAAILHKRNVDLLMAPRNSGVPIATMYATVADIRAVFWDKEKFDSPNQPEFPVGSFIAPTYTGNGDMIIKPPLKTIQHAVDQILGRQLLDQIEEPEITLQVRAALADDMFDSGVTNEGLGNGTLEVLHFTTADFLGRYWQATGDTRAITTSHSIAAMVAPFMKEYKWPYTKMVAQFGEGGIPVAGMPITGIYPRQRAIGVAGVGNLQLRPR